MERLYVGEGANSGDISKILKDINRVAGEFGFSPTCEEMIDGYKFVDYHGPAGHIRVVSCNSTLITIKDRTPEVHAAAVIEIHKISGDLEKALAALPEKV